MTFTFDLQSYILMAIISGIITFGFIYFTEESPPVVTAPIKSILPILAFFGLVLLTFKILKRIKK